MKILIILASVFGLGFLFRPSHESFEVIDEIEPVLSGKKVKLEREYPYPDIFKVTKGSVYNVVDEYVEYKQVSQSAKIPLDFTSIVNDEGKVVVVNKLFFEDAN